MCILREHHKGFMINLHLCTLPEGWENGRGLSVVTLKVYNRGKHSLLYSMLLGQAMSIGRQLFIRPLHKAKAFWIKPSLSVLWFWHIFFFFWGSQERGLWCIYKKWHFCNFKTSKEIGCIGQHHFCYYYHKAESFQCCVEG